MPAPWIHTLHADGPVLATAIHDGHGLRPEVAALTALSDAERLREEDPYTAAFAALGDQSLVVTTSRFEVDLNRPRERAVYREPADAWGLSLWRAPPDDGFVQRSLEGYDACYAELRRLGDALVARHGGFLLLDLHSYNHRRGGPDAAFDDPVANPTVNLGTGSLPRAQWGPLVRRCLDELCAARFDGQPLDVRENVKFRGGALSSWVHATWPGQAVALALEFKKVFMDEWSGVLDEGRQAQLVAALAGALPGLRETWSACL